MVVFDVGTGINEFSVELSHPTERTGPSSIVFDNDGFLCIYDYWKERIVIFSNQFIMTFLLIVK